jgi:hypothetical protein
MVSDLLILKSIILDDYGDSLIFSIFTNVKLWISVVARLSIKVEMTLIGPLAVY